MSRNVEIKAKIESLERLLDLASKLCGSGAEPQIIKQHDTFFNCKIGRLKMREFPMDREVEEILTSIERECFSEENRAHILQPSGQEWSKDLRLHQNRGGQCRRNEGKFHFSATQLLLSEYSFCHERQNRHSQEDSVLVSLWPNSNPH